MKKKISLIFLSALVLISCSSNETVNRVKPVKPNGDYGHSSAPNIQRGTREKIKLENTVFKKMGLPLPYNTFGEPIPYLVPVNDNHKESFSVFEEYNENRALKYFKDLSVR